MQPEQFKLAIASGIVVDTRTPVSFSAHIPGSYNVLLDRLEGFSGWIKGHGKPVYFLHERDEDFEEAAARLGDAGIVKGFLAGGFQAWALAGYDVGFMGLLVPDALAGLLSADKIIVLDVRSEPEWREGHIKEAKHISVGELEQRLNEVPKEKPIACVCASGVRSSLAASILKRAGFRDVYNVLGGITAWKAKDYPLVYEKLLQK